MMILHSKYPKGLPLKHKMLTGLDFYPDLLKLKTFKADKIAICTAPVFLFCFDGFLGNTPKLTL